MSFYFRNQKETGPVRKIATFAQSCITTKTTGQKGWELNWLVETKYHNLDISILLYKFFNYMYIFIQTFKPFGLKIFLLILLKVLIIKI